MKDKNEKDMNLAKEKKSNKPGEPSKPRLKSQTRKSWNLRPKPNKKTQFSTNLILKDGIRNKYQFKRLDKENLTKNKNKKT